MLHQINTYQIVRRGNSCEKKTVVNFKVLMVTLRTARLLINEVNSPRCSI